MLPDINKKSIMENVTQGNKAYTRWRHTSSFILSWKVDGNILGKSFKKTGRRNSIKGTRMNTANGTNLKISAVVLVSCCLSLLERLFPPANLSSNLELILVSAQSSFVPSQ